MTRRRSNGDCSGMHHVPNTAVVPPLRLVPKRSVGARLRPRNPRSRANRARKTVIENLVLIPNP